MKPTMRVITLIAIFPATTALCMDTAPRFEPGEWQIEMSQEGGATFKDSKGKRDDGTSSIRQEVPKQISKICVAEKDARLLPELFAPACRISNAAYKANEMKADLSCGNLSMPMTGSITMNVYKDGKEMRGFQLLSGGGKEVGALVMSSIKMTHLGKCKGK